jgi:hypothetical protein
MSEKKDKNGGIAPLPPPPDEGPSPFVQEGVSQKNLHPASVTYLDGEEHIFHVYVCLFVYFIY